MKKRSGKNSIRTVLSKCWKWIEKICSKLHQIISTVTSFLDRFFLVALIKAVILILALAFLVFSIKPSKAYITADISDMKEYETSFVAGAAKLNTSDCEELTLYSEEPIRINLRYCEIEECRTSDPHVQWLVIYPEEKGGNCRVRIFGRISVARLFTISSNDLYHFNISEAEIGFAGSQQIYISGGRCTLETADGEKKAELSNDFLTMIERETLSYEPIFPAYSPNETDFLANPAISYKAIIESGSLPKNRDSINENKTIAMDLLYYNGSISIDYIRKFKSKLDGNLEISYIPTPNKYHLNGQEIELESSMKPYSDLYLKYTFDTDPEKTKGTISGYVTKSEISKMSLFPSFETWFFSSGYLAPTAIITIVISAVSLFNKKKESKNEKKEKETNEKETAE